MSEPTDSVSEDEDLVEAWREGFERLLSKKGLPFEREDPDFTPDPRWYVQVGQYTVMVGLDPGDEGPRRPALSACLQSFVLDAKDSMDDLFTLLSQCAYLENTGLVGAEGEDGTRLLLLQRRVCLADLEGEDVVPLLEDLIRQYEQVLGDNGPQRIDG